MDLTTLYTVISGSLHVLHGHWLLRVKKSDLTGQTRATTEMGQNHSYHISLFQVVTGLESSRFKRMEK